MIKILLTPFRWLRRKLSKKWRLIEEIDVKYKTITNEPPKYYIDSAKLLACYLFDVGYDVALWGFSENGVTHIFNDDAGSLNPPGDKILLGILNDDVISYICVIDEFGLYKVKYAYLNTNGKKDFMIAKVDYAGLVDLLEKLRKKDG